MVRYSSNKVGCTAVHRGLAVRLGVSFEVASCELILMKWMRGDISWLHHPLGGWVVGGGVEFDIIYPVLFPQWIFSILAFKTRSLPIPV
jgi:hypothetical protein